ncbi:Holliday junction resolvase RuvX [[Mycoplasma] testudinis]|uniref:Holliday junction resolvase RuvX n=1 Tax=[Mycoplasma] testudinis TaxID=33924 RepID=UPI00048832E2|nr:Holliday junction resolvase RuvX [[Mycoplasma] testudinis]
MHYLAIDVGSKYLGLALSDSETLIASPWKTILFPKNNFQFAINQLKSFLEKDGYQILICFIGWPLNMDGSKSQTTLMVEKFSSLFERIFPQIHYLYADERHTTLQAKELLFEMQLKGSVRDKNVDRLSASVIMQNFFINHSLELHILKTSLIQKVAVMRESNLQFLTQYLNTRDEIKNILEVGTGCGYSAYRLSKINSIQKITSIEKDLNRFKLASDYLKENPKIKLINSDINKWQTQEKYDLIILDGPKKQLVEMFNEYQKKVTNHGVLVIDNIWLKHVYHEYELTKNKRFEPLIESNRQLRKFLNNLDINKYNLIIDESGDGLAIIERK